MVMATDFSSNGKMDESRVKPDMAFVANKVAPSVNVVGTRTDKQFTRVLRSKSATIVSSTSTSSAAKKEQIQQNEEGLLSKSPEPEVVHDGSNHKTDSCQATHLRQLLLLHLELIQQQQEELQKKEREIVQLRLDKEQLESRMHRLERRVAVKRRRDFNESYEKLPEEKDVKPAVPKSRRLSVEQMVRGKRVPATASVTMTSHMCEDISYDTHLRTETLYLHGDYLSNLSKQTVDKSKDETSGSHVQVPLWQISELPPSKSSSTKHTKTMGIVSSNENIESIDDEVFAKRHAKHEMEEKRRKRWDIQHMRAMQQHQSLEKKSRDREEARLKGRKVENQEEKTTAMESFLPYAENVMAVEVSDTVPVVAFGFPVPLFHNRKHQDSRENKTNCFPQEHTLLEFEVPWFSLDRRELQERKGKVKPGRTRGKPRGRRMGIQKW